MDAAACGRACATVADAARRVSGFADVSVSGVVDIGPPGAEPS